MADGGRAFCLQVATGSELQGRIKKRQMYTFPAHDLTLYLAKKDEGRWLRWDDADGETFEKCDVPDSVAALMSKANEMYPVLPLNHEAFGFPDVGDGDFHVLVALPKPKRQRVEASTREDQLYRRRPASDRWISVLRCDRVHPFPANATELVALLQRELTEKIPIFPDFIDEIHYSLRSVGLISVSSWTTCACFAGSRKPRAPWRRH